MNRQIYKRIKRYFIDQKVIDYYPNVPGGDYTLPDMLETF